MEAETETRIKELILLAEDQAKKARHEIERARRAGLDVSAQLKDLMETERKITMLKRVYVKEK